MKTIRIRFTHTRNYMGGVGLRYVGEEKDVEDRIARQFIRQKFAVSVSEATKDISEPVEKEEKEQPPEDELKTDFKKKNRR